jgi:hypothetical protein
MPAPDLAVGDRVEVHLDSSYWASRGWFPGVIRRIDPYTAHRSFYWVELDVEAHIAQGGRTSLVSVLNPRQLRRL